MTLRETIRLIESETSASRSEIFDTLRHGHLGKLAFGRRGSDVDELAEAGIPGWPQCECGGCGCAEPATCTDDGGVPVCAECSMYDCDDDGEVICSRMECAECGEPLTAEALDAGGNSTVRVSPCACQLATQSAAEDHDDDGEWAVVDMDGRTISTHATQDGALTFASRCARDFANRLVDTHQANSTAYVPMSVIHLPCGSRRAGQYSTSWYSPGCEHQTEGREIP